MRCFILGAGFSQPAGMPSAGDLTSLLMKNSAYEESDDDFRRWLDELEQAIRLLNGNESTARVSVEELFYYGPSTAEMRRMAQQMCPVGRLNGLTPHSQSEDIEGWLGRLNERLIHTIEECERDCCLDSIERFCSCLDDDDVVVSFNYDTIVERALTTLGRRWNHGLRDEVDKAGVTIFKLHGSVDWFAFSRGTANFEKYESLFRKINVDGVDGDQDARFELCRLRHRDDLQGVLESVGLDLQWENARWWPALGGLGLYKPLHRVPGLGFAWAKAGQALATADTIVVVGFSLSPFDTMARLQLASAYLNRTSSEQQRVIVIDPDPWKVVVDRFRKIYGNRVEAPLERSTKSGHHELDWEELFQSDVRSTLTMKTPVHHL
jgi:hypothetical protein